MRTLPPLPKPAQSFAQQIIEHTQRTYGTRAEQQAPPPRRDRAAESAREKTAGDSKTPASAAEPTFATTKEKILHYLTQAGYLRTQQIIDLCYSHIAETARRPAASRDLKELVTEQKIKMREHGRSNIYYVKGPCNPTDHNLAIRDLYVKIIRSGFAISRVDFACADVPGLTPDLTVDFQATDGSRIRTYWEIDTGTEGIEELRHKVARYRACQDFFRLTFVLLDAKRRDKLLEYLRNEDLYCVVLSEFITLRDVVFHYAVGEEEKSAGRSYF